MGRGYFIAGTDTGVGKTLVATGLLHAFVRAGLRAVGMKPVASGCMRGPGGLRSDDALQLMAAANVEARYGSINPYAFEPAVSPHIAAMQAGTRIELQTILDHYELLAGAADVVIVEGVGGWMAPLGHVLTAEHLAKALALPVVLVVGMRLGCLNHALLTASAIHAAGLRLAGWVANAVEPSMLCVDENIATLEQRIAAPLLGRIPDLPAEDFTALVASLDIKNL
jgi:dethiobiotin synthetase